ncbi:phospholipase [Tigheibacillus jepli]|uniref:phospholipase n=1 Tax=Tigheibacillus jepli TaxID=3035914 RepID=UPI00387E04A9
MPRNYAMRDGFCMFPGYRWCGPGCSGPGAPVNAVDAACMAHDLCYRRPGTSRRSCDLELMNRLRPHLHTPTPEGSHARELYRLMRLKSAFM